MADPRAVVPYYDPHDSPCNTDYINNFSQIISSPTPPPSLLHDIDNINPEESFDAHVIFEDDNHACNEFINKNPQGSISDSNINNDLHVEDDYMVLPLSTLSPPPRQQEEFRNPYSCCICQVLREIVHVNEMTNVVTKLEVHGRVGLICHAILDEGMNVSGAPHHYQMIDFCKKSLEDVKLYLIDYFNKRKQAGFTMLFDPLSFYYEALCVGLEFYEVLTFDQEFLWPSPICTYEVTEQMNQTQAGNRNAESISKSSLSLQRKRTEKLTLEDLESYFDLPIEEAGRLLNLCPTVIKKVCRKYGLQRWPYRKIKSLKRQIANWSNSLTSNLPQDRAHAQVEVHKLQQELSNIYNPST